MLEQIVKPYFLLPKEVKVRERGDGWDLSKIEI